MMLHRVRCQILVNMEQSPGWYARATNLRKIIDKPFDRPLLHTVQSAGYRIADIAQPMA